jgi:GT2 family glycosyltransferase
MQTALAVFVYNRPAHTDSLLRSLARCRGLERVQLHFFCDGAKRYTDRDRVRKVRSLTDHFLANHPGVKVEQDENKGLAASIIEGVSQLLEQFESAIVLEDDLVLNADFLSYHLATLQRYRSKDTVLQISGSNFERASAPSTRCFFLPFISTWGWSTWNRAWSRFKPDEIRRHPPVLTGEARRAFDVGGTYPYSRMLENALRGNNSSWGALWNWHVFSQGGVVLYPARSLIYNTGFDGSGVHCGRSSDDSWQADLESLTENFDFGRWTFPDAVGVNDNDLARARVALSDVRMKQRKPSHKAQAGSKLFGNIRRFFFGYPSRQGGLRNEGQRPPVEP